MIVMASYGLEIYESKLWFSLMNNTAENSAGNSSYHPLPAFTA